MSKISRQPVRRRTISPVAAGTWLRAWIASSRWRRTSRAADHGADQRVVDGGGKRGALVVAQRVPGDPAPSQIGPKPAPALGAQLRLVGQQVDRVPAAGEPLQVGDHLRLDQRILEREVADVERAQRAGHGWAWVDGTVSYGTPADRRGVYGLARNFTAPPGPSRSWTRIASPAMERLDTRLDGPILVRPVVHGDERGFFHESYRRSIYAELGIPEEFVQDNHSRSRHGIVRGMHFQVGAGMAKLVRCGRGAIVDVVVDLRKGSPTFGRVGGVRAQRREPSPAVLPGRLRAWLLRDQRHTRTSSTSARPTTTSRSSAGSSTTTRTWGSSGRDVELIPSERDASAPPPARGRGRAPVHLPGVAGAAAMRPARPM